MPSPHLELFINNVKEIYQFPSWKTWHQMLKRKPLFDSWGTLCNTWLQSPCFDPVFKPLSYLQPQNPSQVLNSSNFIAKWLFPSQKILQVLVCSKGTQPTNRVYSSVSSGHLQITIWAHQKLKIAVKKGRDGHMDRKEAGLSMWLNPDLGWRVGRKKLQGFSFPAR